MRKPHPRLTALRQLGWPLGAIQREAALIRAAAAQRQALEPLWATLLAAFE